MKRILHIIPALAAFLLLASCGSDAAKETNKGNVVTEASNLTIEDGEGWSHVVIRNPWDTTRTLASYILVERGVDVPARYRNDGSRMIRVPLQKALVYSNVHVSFANELGALDAVKGICDKDYITDSLAARRIAEGLIADCGLSTQPNIERVMALRPDAIILAPMSEDGAHGKLANFGIPFVEAADYLEKEPLGRAEWMKFYGRLFGKKEMADSLYGAVAKEYNGIKEKLGNMASRPKVLFDGVYGGVWNVCTSGSVTGNMIEDAHGVNPFADLNKAGSAQLALEKVLYDASDADVWFVRYFKPGGTMSLAEWGSDNKNYSRIKAFKTGNVWGANSADSGIFDDGAFHPQWILADMAAVMHPEIKNLPRHKRYFYQLK